MKVINTEVMQGASLGPVITVGLRVPLTERTALFNAHCTYKRIAGPDKNLFVTGSTGSLNNCNDTRRAISAALATD